MIFLVTGDHFRKNNGEDHFVRNNGGLISIIIILLAQYNYVIQTIKHVAVLMGLGVVET